MSGWRAAAVAAVVGGLVLAVGYFVAADSTLADRSTTTELATDVEVRLACVPALEAVCQSLAAGFDGIAATYRVGSTPEDGVVVIAPASEVPDGWTVGPVVGRTPVAIAVWLERASPLGRHCGGEADLRCLASVYGKQWEELGGEDDWGPFKLGLADPSGSDGALAAWRAVTAEGVPENLAASLRLLAADDGSLVGDMVLFGTARADAVVSTEVAIAAQLENAIGRGGRLVVVYPDPAPWVEYVAAWSGGTGDHVAEALLTPEAQAALTAAGLRPAVGEPTVLPEGLGTPGAALPPMDDATRSTLLESWAALSG